VLILGVDPGTLRTGYGLVRSHGTRFEHVASGVIAVEGEMHQRLRVIADELDVLVAAHRPDAAAVESIFHHKNSRSALALGQARGAILVCLARGEVALFEYTPAEIKRAATGNGRATKETVTRMVRMILGYRGTLANDAADALAAAICHGQRPRSGRLPT